MTTRNAMTCTRQNERQIYNVHTKQPNSNNNNRNQPKINVFNALFLLNKTEKSRRET